jgi:hypothetical protein
MRMLTTERQVFIATVVANLSLSCAKIAIGFQCAKVYTQAKILAVCWTYIGFLAILAIVICFLDVFLCLPSALAEHASDSDARCAGRFGLWLVSKCPFHGQMPTSRPFAENQTGSPQPP